MSSKTTVSVSVGVLLPVLAAMSFRSAQHHVPAKIHLTLATLHAAALTAPRAATDSVDGPYFLVSVLGPRTKTETIHLPESGHLHIRRGEALGTRPLVDLSLEPGDTVRLLVSVLEGAKVQGTDEAAAAAASTEALSQPAAARAGAVSSALAPITKDGAHWLGSATLLLTNERGTTYWRALECVATCKVLSGATATAFAAPSGAPVAGVVELSGAGGSYHMQLQGRLAP
ncbi:MAG: hypothetical protein JWM41_1795 [Gemmatimonadetes bacterium]|nr:hypothetical protein [Gemmatimonadota bacterium]